MFKECFKIGMDFNQKQNGYNGINNNLSVCLFNDLNMQLVML